MSAGIDDGDAGGVGEGRVFGDGEESEAGFVFSRDDGDGSVLGLGRSEKILGVSRDSESHGASSQHRFGSMEAGVGEGFGEGFEGGGGPVGADEPGCFGALTEAGDGGGFEDRNPALVGV